MTLWNREDDDGRLYDDAPEDEGCELERCDVCNRLSEIVRLDLGGFRHCVHCRGLGVTCDGGCGKPATHHANLGEARFCNDCDACIVCGRLDVGGLCPGTTCAPAAMSAGDVL